MTPSAPNETILIVEDEVRVRRSVALFLEDEGYGVVEAGNLEEADRCLDQRGGELALVLLDVWLPDGDGLEFLARRREFGQGLPVVVMSGHANIEMAIRATRLGAFDFLEKPVAGERLGVTVTRALEMARLKRERDELRHDAGAGLLVGESAAMQTLKAQIARISPTAGKVLILGDNGTGKELVARLLHEGSPRRDLPFIRVNSAAIPKDLVESELFGHEKGAFTGAVTARKGKMELAHRGTLFLDEIGDMSLDAQAKLLRAVETGEVERIGGQKTLTVDVRLLAATNKDLQKEIAAGRFREDLYYRLNVVPLRVPALRDRREDVPALIDHFLARLPGAPLELTESAYRLLQSYDWPGNVRELRNVVERLLILGDGPRLDAERLRLMLPELSASTAAAGAPTGATEDAEPDSGDTAGDGLLRAAVEEAEKRAIREAIDVTAGNMTEAARRLGIDRANLYRKIKRYRMSREGDDGR